MTQKTITDKGGSTLRVVDYHGYLTQPFPGISDRFDALPNLTTRDDDVVVVGYPKSGNHWIWELVVRILTNNTGSFSVYFGDHMIEAREDEILNAQTSPRVLVCHLHPAVLSRARNLTSGRNKIIYIIRNPKDVAVSFYTQTYNFRLVYGYDGVWNDYFDLYLNGTVDCGSWFDHVRAWEKYRDEHPELPIHFVFYEDLKKDLLGEIKKLAAFLGVKKEETFFEKIYEATVFPAMKKNFDAHATEELKMLYRNGDLTMLRKGIIGDWKNVFTVSQSERLDAVFADKMKGSKLNIQFE